MTSPDTPSAVLAPTEKEVNAAARALYAADQKLGDDKPFEKFPPGSYWGDRYRSEARAALTAAYAVRASKL